MFLLILLSLYFKSNCSLIFELRPGIQKCYIDELFDNTVLMLKWKIYEEKRKECPEYLSKIKMTITEEETGKKVFEMVPKERKSKTVFSPNKQGHYRICAIYRGRLERGDRLLMNIKLGSNNMDEPKLNNAVKSDDISKMSVKINNILDLAEPVVRRQTHEAELETRTSLRTLHLTRWYKRITYGQIILCFIIGAIQVNNFRKFLTSQNII
ncbi:MAG: emp24/gp25L/p24 family protein [archaeon]|nr:emp24/gp25L/p24 family protein [archaeon]